MQLKKRTNIIIQSDGAGLNMKVIDEATDTDISGSISKADIHLSADSLNVAEITTIGVKTDIKAMLKDLNIICPHCGKNIERE